MSKRMRTILQKIFRRRGAGWIAYKTGIRKFSRCILPLLQRYRLDDYDFDFLNIWQEI